MTKPFTAATLADEFQIHRSTVYRAITDGELRAYRLGRHLRITQEDAESWLKSRCTLLDDTPSDGSRDAGSSSGQKDRAAVVIASLRPVQASPRGDKH